MLLNETSDIGEQVCSTELSVPCQKRTIEFQNLAALNWKFQVIPVFQLSSAKTNFKTKIS